MLNHHAIDTASEAIHCPNCGSTAERAYFSHQRAIRTQCPHCDYLMVTCSLTARVLEAYAPGLYADRL